MLDAQDIIIAKDAARRIVERLGRYDLSATTNIVRYDAEMWKEADLAKVAGCYKADRTELKAEIQCEVFRLSGLQTERDELQSDLERDDWLGFEDSWRSECAQRQDDRDIRRMGGF